MKPQFTIDKSFSMNDEKISIVLEGLPSECLITVKAESTNYYGINSVPNVDVGSLWASSCTFKTSLCGKIDLKTDISLFGSYSGIHGMGLLYSMKPTNVVTRKKSFNLSDIPVYKNYDVQLSAYMDNELLCETSIKRAYQNNDVTYQDVFGKYSVARFFQSQKGKNQPAIIVLSGSDGRIEKAQSIAQQLASHGFATLAVCYFGLNGAASSLSKIPLEIIEEAIAFLKKLDSVNTQKIAIYGRSKGGEMALLAGSMFPEISCVVANTPSSFTFEGLNEKNRNSKTSTWSYHKDDIPYIPFRIMSFLPYIVKKALFKKNDLASVYLKLLDQSIAKNARIAVENIKGPVLFISAANDEIWPSTLLCNKAMEQLYQHNFPYKCEHIDYQNSGHHLTVAYQPNPRYSQKNCVKQLEDEVDSWERTLIFLKNWNSGFQIE